LEMFVDTVWTLAHNNGPIFNKGMLYTGYSGHLYTILDVQAAGQIPQLVSDCIKSVYTIDGVTLNIRDYLLHYGEIFGIARPDFYTDWHTVEALGSKKKYSSYKPIQHKKYGVPPHMAEAEAAKLKAEAEQHALEQAAEASKFYVSPGQFALIVKRNAA